MIYIGYFILIFTTAQLLIALSNLIFLQSFPKTNNISNDLISVLIPVRNEEKNIANILTDLHNQDYQNIEILIFNDQSTDGTEKILEQFSLKDKRIKVFHSEGLPKGWFGKNHACHSLAKKANGKYFLFLDADVRINGKIISQTISLSEKYQLGLLSIFPKQKMQTLGEQITVPVMNFVLLTLLPLILVRKTNFPSLSAANGQFMLFNAETYKKTTPHEKMKSSKVEDIETARYYKQNKIKVACLVGNENISCRMYPSFTDAIEGFSKNVIMFFGNSFALAIFFWLITTFGFVVVFFSFSTTIFLIYLVALALRRTLVSVASKQPALQNLWLIIPQQIALGIFIMKALTNKFKKQFTWKGRNIS